MLLYITSIAIWVGFFVLFDYSLTIYNRKFSFYGQIFNLSISYSVADAFLLLDTERMIHAIFVIPAFFILSKLYDFSTK